MNKKLRIERALEEAYGNGHDGSHHKTYAIDQMVRALTGCPMVEEEAKDYEGDLYTFKTMGKSQEYLEWVKQYQNGKDGPLSYEWDTGIAP